MSYSDWDEGADRRGDEKSELERNGMTMSDENDKSQWVEATATIFGIALIMLLACGGAGWYMVQHARRVEAVREAELRTAEAEKLRAEKERIERESRERESETDRQGEE
jgi:hypothetical protein